MKLWSSVRGQAEKMAFEADKLMRIKREEGAISDMRNQIQNKQASLGQVALELYRAGTLTDAGVATLAQEIAALEGEIKGHQDRITAIRAEQPKTGEAEAPAPAAPAAPQATPPVAPGTPLAPAAPQGVPPESATPAAKPCSNCGKPVPAGAAFCPECGTRAS